ncbi:MAG: aminotransferase class III-fold pyridoxal phosphate-dependent enzyme, partial [Rickettsiales bacterium]
MYLDTDWNRFKEYTWHPYTQEKTAPSPLSVVSSKGSKIILNNGKELIDAISSWWVMCHGHNHDYIKSSMIKQLDVLPHIMFAGIAHEPAYLLSKKLIDILPFGLKKIFYSDSGSIAVEIAIKIALQFWTNSNRYEKKSIVSFRDAYHGDSFLTMQLSDNKYHNNFKIRNNNIYKLEIPKNAESLSQFNSFIIEKKDELAALIIEPIMQAAGGIIFHDSEIISSIYNICRSNNVLFIADEIATGFGRTGSMFASIEANITPDIICIGKALTGGMISLAATIVKEEVYHNFY